MKRPIPRILLLSSLLTILFLQAHFAQQKLPEEIADAIQGQQFSVTGTIYAEPLLSSLPDLTQEQRQRLEAATRRTPLPGPDIPIRKGKVGKTPPTKPNLYPKQTPGDFVFFRNSILGSGTSGQTSVVGEPSVGSNGTGVFQTGNWYASVSSNSGTSFAFVNPFTLFPTTGGFAGGFCCDQRVAHSTSQDMVLWFLQYIPTGTTSNDTNGVRIAAAVGTNNLVNNTWCTLDFTPASFGLSLGKEFDFPHMQVSNNYVYITINVFSITSGFFTEAVMWRIPLTAFLNNCQGGTVTFWVTTSGFALALTQNATTTMYAGTTSTSTSMRVYTQNESDTILSSTLVSGLNTSFFGIPSCPGPDGNNWRGRSDSRIQTAWVTSDEMGFMWNSAENTGSGRPKPFIRALRLNKSTLAVNSQPDIWDTTFAWHYSAIGVNARGHIAGPAWFGSLSQAPSLTILVDDDFNGDPSTTGWENFLAVTGTNSGNNAWGDYLGAQPHDQFSNTWIATGYTLQGTTCSPGTFCSNIQVRYFWFGRDRDNPFGTPALFRVQRDSGGVYADGAYYCGLSGTSTPDPPCFNSSTGADLAEHINVSESVQSGDVIEPDPQQPKHYRKARPHGSVAGVISTQPGVALNVQPQQTGQGTLVTHTIAVSAPMLTLYDWELPLSLSMRTAFLSESNATSHNPIWRVSQLLELQRSMDTRPLLALIGRVPVKATTENGPIQPGDLLRVSLSKPGYAVRCRDAKACESAVVGKALDSLDHGEGLILVLVSSR